VIFWLVLPTQAGSISAQHVTQPHLSQVNVDQTGVNAYRRNLNRLRSVQQGEPARSQPSLGLPATKDLSEPPQAAEINTTPSSQQQSEKATEKQQKFSFKKVFQTNNLEERQLRGNKPDTRNQPEKAQPEKAKPQIVKDHPSQSQEMSAYERVQAAQQPYGAQAGTAYSRPKRPQISPAQLSEQLSGQITAQIAAQIAQFHTSIRQQPERLSKTVVEPLQGKLAQLKKQASTTATTTFKEHIEGRGLKSRELIENSGVSDRIRQTKRTVKASVVDILKHVETKAHETAEQLNDTAH